MEVGGSMERKIIERFTVGGTKSGPNLPSSRALQDALGTRIIVTGRMLIVPTPTGTKVAQRGDTILVYDDNSFDVREKAEI